MENPSPKERRRLGERIKEGDFLGATLLLLVIGTVSVILYDILPAVSKRLGDTISEQTSLWSLFVAFIPAGCGVLCGHLFGPQWWRTPGWITLCLIPYGLALIWCGWRGHGQPRHHEVVTAIFLFHFALGSVAWSQGSMKVRLKSQFDAITARYEARAIHKENSP